MCGISGILSKNIQEVTTNRLKQMTDVIAHRGPDGEGHWVSASGHVGLAHRRLSIIDLSHEADQPMHYLDRYSIVFNGEIYNYVELREDLIKKGYQFTTSSDTEVLLALYHQYGENCLQFLDGMFAFVLYDDRERIAFCARDRFGEKPFFYHYVAGNHFYFGSEMKCLWAAGVPKQIDHSMLFNYLAYGALDNASDPGQTFFQGCVRLPHGHFIKIKVDELTLDIQPYYNIPLEAVERGISIQEASERFSELMYTSIRRRLRSDVAVGSSLSGGLDSSLIVCAIDQIRTGSAQKQKTFSAVFPGFKKDERRYIDYVIAQTQVEPHFVTPTDDGLIRDLDRLAWHQEEPFTSASIYVQYCVMKLAQEQNVTVLLDGQGADEILAGYHGYFVHHFADLKISDPQRYKTEFDAYQNVMAGNSINANPHKGIRNRIKHLATRHVPDIRVHYEHLKQLTNPFFTEDFYKEFSKQSRPTEYRFENLQQALYFSTYRKGLQELLRYADRNSMAHSREVRLPFLSHEVVNFLFSLPAELKIHQGWTKWIMRHTFGTLLPKEIAWRKEKIGFEPPQRTWMENQTVRDRIVDAREKLVKAGICSNKVLQRKIESEESNISRGNSWRTLMSGYLLKD
ncbi:MAG: asparagine synthase (glutamine-hydrolyzing) [Chitinophagaceae bacterium]|nr:asparagine synthase (glutamine-hydrolyzing) [Chitinophagaceae bacterium]